VNDPFEILGGTETPLQPSAQFANDLREQLALLINTPTIALTARSSTMSATQSSTTPAATKVTPYLTVHDGSAALDFYEAAFGATTAMRVVMDETTGQLGHAEFHIGTAAFYLSDEFPDMGVLSPRTLGGTAVALHVEVADVDGMFATAVSAGATSLREPADQPHGARHGTLVDPFGHRWMLSQQIESVSAETYGDRMREQGASVTGAAAAAVRPDGGIWAALNFADAPAGIRFMIDVLGFTEDLIVTGPDASIVEHSQLRWPEGGIVQAATANRPGNVFSERPIGTESLYVITRDPMAVYDRCIAVGTEVVFEPASPDYDPDGLVFAIRDPEGNIWSFGTYAG
jgi:PhnB protein